MKIWVIKSLKKTNRLPQIDSRLKIDDESHGKAHRIEGLVNNVSEIGIIVVLFLRLPG